MKLGLPEASYYVTLRNPTEEHFKLVPHDSGF